jgi:hypothetical protein
VKHDTGCVSSFWFSLLTSLIGAALLSGAGETTLGPGTPALQRHLVFLGWVVGCVVFAAPWVFHLAFGVSARTVGKALDRTRPGGPVPDFGMLYGMIYALLIQVTAVWALWAFWRTFRHYPIALLMLPCASALMALIWTSRRRGSRQQYPSRPLL